jgi:peptidoglycan L-alanyl-D-glutamate endopeptidase CwlK
MLKQAGHFSGAENGACGADTVAAIIAFQRTFLSQPDGRIDVDGRSWRNLCEACATVAAPRPANPPSAAGLDWSGDSSHWPEEQKIASLDPAFRPKVERVLQKLRAAGFQARVHFGWRSVAVQRQLVAAGHSKVAFSFHNAQKPDGTPNAYAVDIIDARWGWSDDAERNGFWKALGDAGKAEGCVWGGDWTSFKDVAHIQDKPNAQLAMVKAASGLA